MSAESAPSPEEYTVDGVKQLLFEEDECYAKQLPEVMELLESKQSEILKLLATVREQEKKATGVHKDIEQTRGVIEKKRSKGEADSVEDLKKNATQALPVFVQTLTQYQLAEEERKTAGSSKLKFWKKSPSPESPSPDGSSGRTVLLNLDIPSGTMGGCGEPTSGFSVSLMCKEPTKSLEELAEEGGTVTLNFALKKDASAATEEVIESAKRYFEEYFAARAKEEGAVPDIQITATSGTLTARVKLSVKRDKVGGVLGKLESIAAGEFMGKGEVLGKYSEEQVTEALKQLRHTRLTGSFNSEVGFGEVVKEGVVNWGYFDKVSGAGDLVLQRCVYKAVQKVVDLFSTVAAAKMSIGGKFFKRLNFKVDGLIFKALREDAALVASIDENIESLLGYSVSVTPEVLHDLSVLSSSISGVRSADLDLPALSLQLQFQNFDFFGLALDAAEFAKEKQNKEK